MSQPDVVRIVPRHRVRLADFRELWEYRELVGVLASRDVRVRYRQSVLGVAWAVLRPLIAAGLMTLVFGRLAKIPSEGLPYSVFALLGVVPWTFFSGSVSAAAESLVGSQVLVTRVYFPRLALPLAALGAPLVDLAVSLSLVVVVVLVRGLHVAATWAFVPLGLLILAMFAAGLGAGLGAINAIFRDVRHIVPFALQLGMYASPVVYPASMVPERFRAFYYLNPATGAIEAIRGGFAGHVPPIAALLTSFGIALLTLGIGVLIFLRTQWHMADVV